MPQGFPLTSFEGTIEAEFGQLLQRVISKHQQCLKELDGAWRSTAILEEESHTCSRRSGQSQSGCNQSVLETLQEVGDEAVNSVQSSLAQGLQQVYDQCVRQNASLDVLSEKLERATLTMGLSALRLREHRDFRGPTGVRDADDGRSWSSSKSTATQMSLSMGLSHSIAAVTARTNPEDFKPYPVWRKRPKMSQPWVMKHRHHDQYHRAMLTKLDLLEKHSYRHQGSLIVNPNSTFRMTWEILGMLFLMYDLAVVPLLVFQPQSSTVFRVVDWIIMLFWTTDIAVSFRLAYFTKHGELKKQACAIAIHYCKRWFIFDLIVTSLDWVVVVGFGENSFLKSAKVVRGLRFLRFIRLLRIVKIGNFVSAIRLHINSQYAYMVTGIIEYLVVVVLVNHLIACTWFWIGSSASTPNWVEHYGFRDAEFGYKYIVSLHWSLTQFTPASMQVQPQNGLEQTFAVFVLVLALVIFGSFISSITMAMTALRSVHFMRADQFWMLRKYMRQHAISQDLIMHVTRYLTIAVSRQRAFIQEDQVHILALLSAPLRLRLKNELFSKQLMIHPLFESISKRTERVINMICCTAIQEDHLSLGDLLFHCGEAAKKMYFVEEGKLAYLREKYEMALFEVAEWCCEIILWSPWVHRGDMHARTDCTILALDPEHFQEVVLSFPSDAELPRRYAKEFCKRLTELYADGEKSFDRVSDMGSSGLDPSILLGLISNDEEQDSDEGDNIESEPFGADATKSTVDGQPALRDSRRANPTPLLSGRTIRLKSATESRSVGSSRSVAFHTGTVTGGREIHLI